MTVAELIRFLEGCPRDYRVMVSSYELGIEDLVQTNCRITRAELNAWADCNYLGPHDESDAVEGTIPVVLLAR